MTEYRDAKHRSSRPVAHHPKCTLALSRRDAGKLRVQHIKSSCRNAAAAANSHRPAVVTASDSQGPPYLRHLEGRDG